MESRPEREPLSGATIVAGAIALADESGVGALTMRNVAGRVGYEVMSLYNHIANKDMLLAAMVEAVAAEIEEPETMAGLDAARAIAMSTRAALVRHPWASELWLAHLPGQARTRQMEKLLEALSHSGLSPDLAHHAFHAVNNHVLGYTLQERGMMAYINDPAGPEAMAQEFLDGIDTDAHPFTVAHVHQHLDGDSASSFELVLDIILDGLVLLEEKRTGRNGSGQIA